MPEGHLIHRVADDHQIFVGATVKVRSPDGRFMFGAEELDRQTLQSVDAWGKHLLYQFKPKSLHIHLGLEGSIRFRKAHTLHEDQRARLLVQDERTGDSFLLYNPLHCELLSSFARKDLIRRLGPDLLRPDADPEITWTLMQRSQAGLGEFLLDQSCISGIGNIYRSEILFLLRMHPHRRAGSLTREEFDTLWRLAADLLEVGRHHNAIITASPKRLGKPREQMHRSERVLVYRKRECPDCGALLTVERIANRTAWFCERCQSG